MSLDFDARLIAVGEVLRRPVRYSRDDIRLFAQLSGDENPLHLDPLAAKQGRFGEVIASGQQTAAIMMGMLATHFSRADDGLARQMLCLNMNFAFKEPIFAEQAVELVWRVTEVTPNQKLHGLLGLLDGRAAAPGGASAVIARGTVLVSAFAA